MTIWHLRAQQFGRAYAIPLTYRAKLIMLFRGWRPFGANNHVWSKPSHNQSLAEAGENVKSWRKTK